MLCLKLSSVRLFVTPWTVAHQAPLSMGMPRQEYWSGLPCPPPGDLPNPGIKPRSPTLQVEYLLSEPPGKTNFCHKTMQISHNDTYIPSLSNIPPLPSSHSSLKSFCTAKATINKLKRQTSEWEKIIANETTDRRLISRIYKEFVQLIIRKKMVRRPKQTFLQRRHTDGQ